MGAVRGAGGISYDGVKYDSYKDYVEKQLDAAYNYGLINEGTYKYLLTTGYNIY